LAGPWDPAVRRYFGIRDAHWCGIQADAR
jgi:hypothetical protein